MNILWPSVKAIESAKSASLLGVAVAVFSAVITAVAAVWALISGTDTLGYVNAWALLDAAIFGAIAYGIFREKRWVAVFGLVFFMSEKVVQLTATGKPGGVMIWVVVVLGYISAIRGLFSLHRLRRETGTRLDEASGDIDSLS